MKAIIYDIQYSRDLIEKKQEIDHLDMDNKYILMKRKRYKATSIDEIVNPCKRQRTTSKTDTFCIDTIQVFINQTMTQLFQPISHQVVNTFTDSITANESSVMLSVLYGIYLVGKFYAMNTMNLYFFTTDHQHSVRICCWGKYIVIMDLLKNYSSPGKYGFQIDYDQLYNTDKFGTVYLSNPTTSLLHQLLPIVKVMAANLSTWKWGVNEVNPSKMTQPKFLIESDVCEWYHKKIVGAKTPF